MCNFQEKEYFYDCKWSLFGAKTVLAAGGLRGVVRVLDITKRSYLKPVGGCVRLKINSFSCSLASTFRKY